MVLWRVGRRRSTWCLCLFSPVQAPCPHDVWPCDQFIPSPLPQQATPAILVLPGLEHLALVDEAPQSKLVSYSVPAEYCCLRAPPVFHSRIKTRETTQKRCRPRPTFSRTLASPLLSSSSSSPQATVRSLSVVAPSLVTSIRGEMYCTILSPFKGT